MELPIPTYYGDEICHVNGLKYAADVILATLRNVAHRAGLLYQRRFEPLSELGNGKRSDGLLGESGNERRRLHQAPPGLYATALFLDSTRPRSPSVACVNESRVMDTAGERPTSQRST